MNESSQNQKAGMGAIAVQSAGNTEIHQGLSVEQFSQIMTEIRSSVVAFTSLAEQKIAASNEAFQQKIEAEIASQKLQDISQFGDPDFQFHLRNAFISAARLRDEELEDNLVGLIIQRASEEKRSPRSLIIGEAIEAIGSLGESDVQQLALLLFLTRIVLPSPTIEEISETYLEHIAPLFDKDLPRYVFERLDSRGLVSISNIASRSSVEESLIQQYPGVFTSGFDYDELEKLFSRSVLAVEGFVVPSDFVEGKFRLRSTDLNFYSKDFQEFVQLNNSTDLESTLEEYARLCATKQATKPQIREKLTSIKPELSEFLVACEKSPIQYTELRPVGSAIAVSYLRRIPNFKLDIKGLFPV